MRPCERHLVMVPPTSPVAASDSERMAARAHDDLAKTLGTSVLPMTIPSARHARQLPPGDQSAVVGERGGRRDGDRSRAGRRAGAARRRSRRRCGWRLRNCSWPVRSPGVRPGCASAPHAIFRRSRPRVPRRRDRCPVGRGADARRSAPAQREAETRAEACFARELRDDGDWRSVR